MARRKVTEIMYEKMLDAYRAVPGNYSYAAAKSGCDPRTTKRAWHLGWPDQALAPIKDVLEAEQIDLANRVRANRQAEFEAEAARKKATHEKAQEDAIRTKTEEAQMVRALRLVSRDSLQIVAAAFAGAKPLVEKIKTMMETVGTDPTTNLRTVFGIMREAASIARTAGEAAKISAELERLIMNEPAASAPPIGAEVSAEEAVELLADLERTMRRAKELGYTETTPEEQATPVVRQDDASKKVH